MLRTRAVGRESERGTSAPEDARGDRFRVSPLSADGCSSGEAAKSEIEVEDHVHVHVHDHVDVHDHVGTAAR